MILNYVLWQNLDRINDNGKAIFRYVYIHVFLNHQELQTLLDIDCRHVYVSKIVLKSSKYTKRTLFVKICIDDLIDKSQKHYLLIKRYKTLLIRFDLNNRIVIISNSVKVHVYNNIYSRG